MYLNSNNKYTHTRTERKKRNTLCRTNTIPKEMCMLFSIYVQLHSNIFQMFYNLIQVERKKKKTNQ